MTSRACAAPQQCQRQQGGQGYEQLHPRQVDEMSGAPVGQVTGTNEGPEYEAQQYVESMPAKA